MGSALSSPKRNSSPSPVCSTKSYPAEITNLRDRVRKHSTLTLLERYILLLYFPPNYPEVSVAQYICNRVEIPLYPPDDMEYLLQELEGNEKYRNGLIVRNYSTKFEDVDILKKQAERLGMKLCLFFFEMDAETLGNALDKFDRWVTPSSNRSYHISSTPPKSYLVDQSMVDDITGELLIKLPEDTTEYYSREYRNSRQRHSQLYFLLYSISHTIPGGSTATETQRSIDQALYTLIAGDIHRKSNDGTSYTLQSNSINSSPL